MDQPARLVLCKREGRSFRQARQLGSRNGQPQFPDAVRLDAKYDAGWNDCDFQRRPGQGREQSREYKQRDRGREKTGRRIQRRTTRAVINLKFKNGKWTIPAIQIRNSRADILRVVQANLKFRNSNFEFELLESSIST